MLPDGQRWVRLVVFGQSFILHQIRKMVGTALAVFRGAAPPDAIASALRREGDVATPMAPELGLFLAETVYSHYNSAWAGDNGGGDDDDDEEEEDEDDDEEGGGGGSGGVGNGGDAAASEKIDPALQQQHREYLEQQAKQRQKQRQKRECLSLGTWGDAAEKFKVKIFFFFVFLLFTFSVFLFFHSHRFLFSPSLSTNNNKTSARVRLPSHRESRRREKDERRMAPLAQRPQLPLLELELRGAAGAAPRGQGEAEGSDGGGGGWGDRGGEEEPEAARRRRRRRRRQGAAQRREGQGPGKRRRRRRLQQTCCCCCRSCFRCPACSRGGLRGRFYGGRVVGLKRKQERERQRDRERERKRNAQKTALDLFRNILIFELGILFLRCLFLSRTHTIIVFAFQFISVCVDCS